MTTSKKKDLFSYLEIFDEEVDGESFTALSMGAPGREALAGCSELMTECTKQVLSDQSEEQFTFQYGPPKGDPGFCNEMAGFLTQQYGDTVSSDDIFVTAGATQGLHLVATVMFDKNTPIFMEDPTYFIAVNILKKDLGLNVIPVPTTDEGIDFDILEELLEKHKPASLSGYKTPFWAMVYTIPTYNNPKGYCMPKERCEKFVSLARKFDVLLFAEDVYNMLHYNGEKYCPPRLLSYDKKSDPDYKGNVISNCTFSKILAPGLRMGWIETGPRIISYLEKSYTAWSGGAFNHYTSKIMAVAIQNGQMSKHLDKLRKDYGERMEIGIQELESGLPPQIKCNNPRGGFFIWLELPPNIDAMDLLQLAVEKYKVNFIYGSSTSPTGGSVNCARLSISFCVKDKIREGFQRFCAALKDIMSTNDQTESSK